MLSQQSPSELLYVVVEDFDHPLLEAAAALPDGVTTVPSTSGGVALDFIRGNLFDRSLLRSLPASAPGPDNDLADLLELYTKRAEADPAARMYAFGERWGPEVTTPDKVFGFSPGNGVHDIHMNQGNNGRFTVDDGVWQDGGLCSSTTRRPTSGWRSSWPSRARLGTPTTSRDMRFPVRRVRHPAGTTRTADCGSSQHSSTQLARHPSTRR